MNITKQPVRLSGARASERGIALVIVLGFLVLISALVIAFFSSVQTELVSAKSYAAGASVKQLAETATNVVMSQVIDATKTFEIGGSPGSGKRLTWASQPGLIHTFDGKGDPAKTFKLYSAWNMVANSGTGYLASKELSKEVPNDWATRLAGYTDLNSPVLVSDEKNGDLTGVDGNKYFASYPILNPDATAEGFTAGLPPGYTPSSLPTDKPSANRAAMPVAWLYVLQNGTITSPADADATKATWGNLPASSPNKPSATNPIVGRIAFWTDDECSKININTASEPTPWDTPRGLTKFDLAYGKYQPANQEFQRYPGHPYGVALSTVLFPNESQKLTTAAQKAAFNKKIYDAVPRVTDGGTKSGTVAVDAGLAQSPLDADRLYASMDEFLYSPSRTINPATDPTILNRSSFFLTATSRAPELNLFGLPRVSLWPLNSTGALSAYDKLAAFCSTLGDPAGTTVTKFPFYFQRAPANVISPTLDWSGIKRNQDVYNYLKSVTSQEIPGFGGSFKIKFGDDHEQILTEIFDYIRCTNLRDTQAGVTQYAPRGQVVPIVIGETRGFGRFHSFSQFGMQFICSQDGTKGLNGGITGTGAVTPTSPAQKKLAEGTRAIEAAFLMEPFSPSLGYYKLDEEMSVKVTFMTPMTLDGFPLNMQGGVGNIVDKIRDGFHKNGRERGGTGGLRGSVEGFYVSANGGGKYLFASGNAPERVVVNAITKATMFFSGGTVKVEVFQGQGGTGNSVQTFTIQIPKGNFPIPRLVTEGPGGGRGTSAGGPEWWWQFSTRFSAMNNTPYLPSEKEYPGKPWRTWGPDNDGQPPGFKKGSVIHAFDVVRSVVPKHGDIRLTAARKDGGSDQFEMAAKTQADWEDSAKPMMHIFQESGGSHFQYGNANEPGLTSELDDQLVGDSKIKYHYARLPEIKAGAGKIYNKFGDFDNGMACWTDGSYINKPDEGNINASGNSGSYPYFSWDFTEPKEVNFSPNRLVPSAGMLGSLPTGVKRHSDSDPRAWQTLLFRPQKDHPGNGAPVSGPPYTRPPDHLIMDLFWMPVIEPYAISEAFSTAGKINMNYEIAPFTYIKRATGLHAVLKGEEPMVVPNEASKYFKLWDHEVNDYGQMPNSSTSKDVDTRTQWGKLFSGAAPYDKIRWPIDAEATLEQFRDQFDNKGVFRSASQICEMHLVRKGEALTSYKANTIWPLALATGDNTRERPYTNLYAKLTTKSNSFTVHMRVQVLRKKATTKPEEWVEGQDQIASEYRGSTLIERYIDASSKLPDFALPANSTSGSMDDYYKFRVVSSKKFTP